MASARRARGLRIAAIILLIVAILVVAVDRIGVMVAENVVADRIASSQHLQQKPDVDIHGVPFVTQVLSGELDHVTITVNDLTIGQDGRQITLSSLTTDLRDVTTSDDFHSVQAKTLTATGTTTLGQIGQAIGQNLSPAGNGRVALTAAATVFGQTVSASVSSKPVIQNGELAFTDVQTGGAAAGLSGVLQQVSSYFDLQVPLDGIPFGLTPQSVTVDGSTVHFTLSGADVTLTGRG